jgi:hypothetical protein
MNALCVRTSRASAIANRVRSASYNFWEGMASIAEAVSPLPKPDSNCRFLCRSEIR